MGNAVFVFTRQGRSPRTVTVLIGVYTVLLAAIILIDAAWWLMALLALPTLPAVWDLWTDPSAGLRLDAEGLGWHSGRRHGALAWTEVDHVRLDTRWDLSVRATAVLVGSKKVRLPYESLPPHRVFEAELSKRGVSVQRHHFTVF